MNRGKIKESILNRSVLPYMEHGKTKDHSKPYIYGDFARTGDVITAVNTAVGDPEDIVASGIYRALNGMFAAGAKPETLEMSIVMPEFSEEEELKYVMKSLCSQCEKEGIAIKGGHTETSPYVTKWVVTYIIAGAGAVKSPAEPLPGMDIIMAGYGGLEGSAYICRHFRDKLLKRYEESYIEEGERDCEDLSIKKICSIAQKGNTVIHDLSSTGIYGGIWEMMEGFGLGCDIYVDEIPFKQHCIEFCEETGADIYYIRSLGSAIIITDTSEELQAGFKEAGIPYAVIGRVREDKDKMLICNDKKEHLRYYDKDEILERLEK